MFKAILLDLDNTLYDYDLCHNKAILNVLDVLSSNFNLSPKELFQTYQNISNNLKNELGNSASSHNRLIYFNLLCEEFRIPIIFLEEMNKIYWESFYSIIELNDGVMEFLNFLVTEKIKIYILTDYTLNEQILKLKALKILNYIERIFSSEEIGIEKPSLKAFTYCMSKIGLTARDIAMVGDNYYKDIKGALNASLYPFWYNKYYDGNIIVKKENVQFNNFNQLTIFLKEIKKAIDETIELSRYCGERFDLIQYCGGNISIKTNELMIIKSSGMELSDITEEKLSILTRGNGENLTFNLNKPSMEYLMHDFLPSYVVHLHPIQINTLLITKEGKEILRQLFPESLIIDYFTPSFELSEAIKERYSEHKVIFLSNHGVIFTTDTFSELHELIENTLDKIEIYLGLDLNRFKLVSKLTNYINLLESEKNKYISYFSEDSTIKDYIRTNKIDLISKYTFPDQVIYCPKILKIDEINYSSFKSYYDKNRKIPSLILFNNKYLYIVATSFNKCRGIESLVKSTLMINDQPKNELSLLPNNKIIELLGLESEKYRQNIR